MIMIMRFCLLTAFLACFCIAVAQVTDPQINTQRIQIARDSFGVPHIFAPTDPEVAYGLAWAHAEDDFTTIQTLILTGKGKLATNMGKKGAPIDYVFGLLDPGRTVKAELPSLDPRFLQLVKGYLLGLEAYARKHPEAVLNKNVFPVSVEEYLAAATFSIAVFSGVDRVLPAILNNQQPMLPGFMGEGSNAFAIRSQKSAEGMPMLVINAHQPIEGATAFYEAHLCSEEGWNILGGLFPGAPMIFHGVNENLGWAHTVNLQDKIDVYQLETDKAHPGQYKVDGEWLKLEERRIPLRIKGIPFTVKKKAWYSIYGPTVKSPSGAYFSLRLPALLDAAALQQWYAMNKARNYTEFRAALEQQHLSMFNIIYADRYDTIFYVSNGKMPERNPDPAYHWNSTVPGNTRATLWTRYKPFTALPQYLNPSGGYLFNTNHSPFLAAAPQDNLNPANFDRKDGYELYNNNRSQRARELISPLDKISYAAIKQIKFDRQLPDKILYPYGYASDSLFLVDANQHDSLRSLIQTLAQWDHRADTGSRGAALYLLAYSYIPELKQHRSAETLTLAEAVQVYSYMKSYLIRYFGTTDVSLGNLQKLVRGKQEWPQAGISDVLAAVMSEPYKNGLRRMNSGDAYIGFVRFPVKGYPLIETVNTFGASADPKSPHFADQRPLFQAQQLKKMTLSREEVLRLAVRVYYPG